MKAQSQKFTKPVMVRITEDMAQAVLNSGKSPGEWFREAGQDRLEREQRRDTPMSRLETQVARFQQATAVVDRDLKNDIGSMQREIARLQQTTSVLLAMMTEVQKQIAALHSHQLYMEKDVGTALTAIGPTILTGLGEMLRGPVKKPERPSINIPPVGPRTKL